MTKQEQLREWIKRAESMVFFGGAGVSTESGIPDFRSVDGLYHEQYDDPPETILSHSYFMEHPEAFYRFYKQKMLVIDAKPNPAHLALAKWEKENRLNAVITQNIDGLHQKAGSSRVLELHGSIYRNNCIRCHKAYSAREILQADGVPRCSCGGIIKPDVVLYGESLSQQTIEQSIQAIERADLLIVGGTSLVVHPAAGLVRYFRGEHLVVINRTPTPLDSEADLLLTEPIGEVLGRISEQIG